MVMTDNIALFQTTLFENEGPLRTTGCVYRNWRCYKCEHHGRHREKWRKEPDYVEGLLFHRVHIFVNGADWFFSW